MGLQVLSMALKSKNTKILPGATRRSWTRGSTTRRCWVPVERLQAGCCWATGRLWASVGSTGPLLRVSKRIEGFPLCRKFGIVQVRHLYILEQRGAARGGWEHGLLGNLSSKVAVCRSLAEAVERKTALYERCSYQMTSSQHYEVNEIRS